MDISKTDAQVWESLRQTCPVLAKISDTALNNAVLNMLADVHDVEQSECFLPKWGARVWQSEH